MTWAQFLSYVVAFILGTLTGYPFGSGANNAAVRHTIAFIPVSARCNARLDTLKHDLSRFVDTDVEYSGFTPLFEVDKDLAGAIAIRSASHDRYEIVNQAATTLGDCRPNTVSVFPRDGSEWQQVARLIGEHRQIGANINYDIRVLPSSVSVWFFQTDLDEYVDEIYENGRRVK